LIYVTTLASVHYPPVDGEDIDKKKGHGMSDQNVPREQDQTSIGIDIGGTSTRVGIFQTRGQSDFTLLDRFPTHQNYQQQLHAIVAAVKSVQIAGIKGAGISIGGRIAQDGRSVIFAPNMMEYIGKPFALDLEQQLGCPVRLAHDTVCGLLGEKKFGNLRESARCAYLTLSTGTGAAFQLCKGTHSFTVSIDIGHQILDGNTRVCLCGQVGCLETFTGGKQLALRLGHALEQETSRLFWETFVEKLAIGLLNLTQLAKVEIIAVSGAIALNRTFLLPLLQQKIDRLLVGSTLQLCPALLGERAPIVGAATLLEVPEEMIIH
jgi:predicted NBD/HSP70 family sugar kinase